jgi:hypothetical protein
MTTSTELTFVSTIEALQKDLEAITNSHNNTMKTIASGIKFNPNMTDEVKEKLIEFAAEQERIANHQSLTERFMRKVSTVPLLGRAAKHSADELRKNRLNEESVAGLVRSMYLGLKKQADDVEATERELISIYNQTETNITSMQELDFKITTLVQANEIPMQHRSRVMRMATQIKTMIEKSKDKLESLQIIIPTTQACLEMIYQDLPISEADLLSDMAMSTGVAQINALSQDVKEMRELSDLVSTNIWSRTQKSIVNLIELNTVSDRDIQRIENNANEREKLRTETVKAAQKASQQIQQAYLKIEALAIESNERRSENTLLLGTTYGH